jgi:hypothetical protein
VCRLVCEEVNGARVVHSAVGKSNGSARGAHWGRAKTEEESHRARTHTLPMDGASPPAQGGARAPSAGLSRAGEAALARAADAASSPSPSPAPAAAASSRPAAAAAARPAAAAAAAAARPAAAAAATAAQPAATAAAAAARPAATAAAASSRPAAHAGAKKKKAAADGDPAAPLAGPGHEEGADGLSAEVFSNYVPRAVQAFAALAAADPHPADVVEAASLSAVALPPVDPAIAAEVADALAPCIDAGSLSQLQVEGVLLACAKHAQDLADGSRAGFFLGDSAGVGKGRQIAGCIAANAVAGRRRALWVSTSRDLVADARRDMDALCGRARPAAGAARLLFGGGGGGGGAGAGAGGALPHIPIFAGPDDAVKAGPRAGGVLFTTYTTLARKGWVGGGGKGQKRGRSAGAGAGAAATRLEQVVAWLAAAAPGGRPEDFDGVICFDER